MSDRTHKSPSFEHIITESPDLKPNDRVQGYIQGDRCYDVYATCGSDENYSLSVRRFVGYLRIATRTIVEDFGKHGIHLLARLETDDLSLIESSGVGAPFTINLSYLPKDSIKKKDIERIPDVDPRRASICLSFSGPTMVPCSYCDITYNN